MTDEETHIVTQDVATALGIAQQCVEVTFACGALPVCADPVATVTMNNDCNEGAPVTNNAIIAAVSGKSAGSSATVSFGAAVTRFAMVTM